MKVALDTSVLLDVLARGVDPAVSASSRTSSSAHTRSRVAVRSSRETEASTGRSSRGCACSSRNGDRSEGVGDPDPLFRFPRARDPHGGEATRWPRVRRAGPRKGSTGRGRRAPRGLARVAGLGILGYRGGPVRCRRGGVRRAPLRIPLSATSREAVRASDRAPVSIPPLPPSAVSLTGCRRSQPWPRRQRQETAGGPRVGCRRRCRFTQNFDVALVGLSR